MPSRPPPRPPIASTAMDARGALPPQSPAATQQPPQPQQPPTATPEAAVRHYHSLFLEQPATFAQTYVANAAFRSAVHACGLALVAQAAPLPPALVRVPVTPYTPQYEKAPAPIPAPTPGLPPVRRLPAEGRPEMQPNVQRLFDAALAGAVGGIPAEVASHGGPRFGAIGERPQGARRRQGDEGGLVQQKQYQQHAPRLPYEQREERRAVAPVVSGENALAQPPVPTGNGQRVSDLTAEIDALFLQQRRVTPQAQRLDIGLFSKGKSISTPQQSVVNRDRGGGNRDQRGGEGKNGGWPGRDGGGASSTSAIGAIRRGGRGNTALAPKRVRVSSRTTEPLPSSPTAVTAPAHVFELLNRQAWDLYDQIRPEDGEGDRRARLLAHMNKLAKSEWGPDSCVRTFGSSASGLNLRGGDIDMCLVVPPQPLPKRQRRPRRGNRGASGGRLGGGMGGGRGGDGRGGRGGADRGGAVSVDDDEGAMTDKQIMRIMAQILRRSKMTIIQELPSARVPILKVMDPVSSFQLDVCLNNELGHYNTNLLMRYANMDWRVRPLCLLVKYWAKRRGINDVYRGTLGSYAYVLMIIQFLQNRPRPVLPCLQQMVNGKRVAEGARLPSLKVSSKDGVVCNVHFDNTISKFDAGNQESLGELLVGFLFLYAFDFKYQQQVVCARLGRLIGREDKLWDEETVARELEGARLKAEAEEEEKEPRKTRRGVRKDAAKGAVTPNGPQISPFDDQNFPSLGSTKPPNGPPTPNVAMGVWNAGAYGAAGGGAGLSSNDTDSEDDSYAASEARREAAERKIRKVTRHVFCIEDPFDLTHDLGRNLDAETLQVVRHEFVRAHSILVSTGDIHRACEKFESADF